MSTFLNIVLFPFHMINGILSRCIFFTPSTTILTDALNFNFLMQIIVCKMLNDVVKTVMLFCSAFSSFILCLTLFFRLFCYPCFQFLLDFLNVSYYIFRWIGEKLLYLILVGRMKVNAIEISKHIYTPVKILQRFHFKGILSGWELLELHGSLPMNTTMIVQSQ